MQVKTRQLREKFAMWGRKNSVRGNKVGYQTLLGSTFDVLQFKFCSLAYKKL